MNDDRCVVLRHWLAGPGPSSLPDPALVAHVAACPRCRGVLATLAATLLVQPPEQQPSCDAVADALPAYVELAHTEGEAAAARHDPVIWWHLWTCPTCAEVAEDIAILLAAEANGELEPPPLLSTAPPRLTLPLAPIRFARDLLHAVFAPQQALGAMWNSGDDQLFLAEERLPGCRLVIHVRQESSEHWCVEVSIEPPVDGDLVVRFAEVSFRAPIAQGRHARLCGIPAALLTNPAGPDMLLSIEPGAGNGRDPSP